ncbi:MAG: alcohol dehydrogenase catalytic domain-containing protein [bacterium]
MKALVFHGTGDLRYEDVPAPAIADGEVLIRVRASGICGSDLHGYTGKSNRRCPPMIMGHEFAGEVVEGSSGARRFTPGDRVVIQPLCFCGACDMCAVGLTNLCRSKSLFGVFSKNGAMAEFIAVPEKLLFPLPVGMSYEAASLMEPLAVAYSAVVKADFRGKRKVLVVGCGAIGLCIIKLVKALADVELVALDVQEYRLEAARRLGADHGLDSSRDDVRSGLAQLNPQGADIAFEAVGFGATVKLALENLGVNGQCVWVGNSAKTVEVDMQDVVVGMKTIRGTYAYTHEDFRNALAVVAEKHLELTPVISAVAPLSEGVELFRRLAAGKDRLIKVVLKI